MQKKQNIKSMTHQGSEATPRGMFRDKFKNERWKPIPGTELYWNIPNEKFLALWRTNRNHAAVLGYQMQHIDGNLVTVFDPAAMAQYVDFLLWGEEAES